MTPDSSIEFEQFFEKFIHGFSSGLKHGMQLKQIYTDVPGA
jgi:hypothetical protein